MHPRAAILAPCIWQEHPEYRAVLNRDMSVDLKRGYKGEHRFYDSSKLLATLTGDILVIKEGYASDLCSPAIKIGKHWYGTPSGECEAPAAFVHDCLRQVATAKVKCCPWNRKESDRVFFDLLREAKSQWARLYFLAVSGVLGSLYLWLTGGDSNVTCRDTRCP